MELREIEMRVRTGSDHYADLQKKEVATMTRRLMEFVKNGLNGIDDMGKHWLALAKLIDPALDTHGIPAFQGLRAAYHAFGGDQGVDGWFDRKLALEGLRACQDFNSGTFSFALQNALNMYLSKIYRNLPFHEDAIISQRRPTRDLRPIRSISLQYFQDLPTLDTETGDYQDFAPFVDTEAQYEISEKGVLVWITRKVIANDYIDIVRGIVERLARAARRTHARYAWSFFIDNAACPDGTSWFTGAHGNLGTNALSIATAAVAIRALAGMTEPGSDERLSVDLGTAKWSLVIDIANWETAVRVNQLKSYYTADDLTTKEVNPCRYFFGKDNERIIISPFMTDANDWGILRDKEDVPLVEMSYLMGKEEPELLVSDVPGNGPSPEQVFKGRRLGYRLSHDFGGAVGDYRGAYKSTP
jgi:hypothetical protein